MTKQNIAMAPVHIMMRRKNDILNILVPANIGRKIVIEGSGAK